MYRELVKYVAAINFFYERVALYYQYNYCTVWRNDYLSLPDCIYLSMFRNTFSKMQNCDAMLEQLKQNTTEYFDKVSLVHWSGNNRISEDYSYIWEEAENIWRIHDCFNEEINLDVNIYMISAYVFLNACDSLLYNRFGYDKSEIRLLYFLLLSNDELPKEALDMYCKEKHLDHVTDDLLKDAVKELIQSYFNQIKKVFDKDVHESWERTMGQNRSELLLRVEKIFQGSRIGLRKVVDQEQEEIEG